MKIIDIEITPPTETENHNKLPLWNEFFNPVYVELYSAINPETRIYPHIDFDILKINISKFLNQLSISQINQLRKLGNSPISPAEWNKSPENKAMMVFFWHFPIFANLLQNIHLLAPIAIKSAEIYCSKKISPDSFINAKQFIDKINLEKWSRAQTDSEQQSGVSNLGGVSEMLLEMALSALIDGTNFFKTQNQKIQSYGDFVLMCLPNNLWLSVKSNFARERLLASGYTTDILGVGFFTSKEEFISQSKIRNFQRVGFLAMYLPDIPISDAQVASNTNTYQEVVDEYKRRCTPLPLNINGTYFLRPLSSLHMDISKILGTKDIRNRTTLEF